MIRKLFAKKAKDIIEQIGNFDKSYNNLQVVDELIEFIDTSSEMEKIKTAYLILGRIGENNVGTEIVKFLIEKYKAEKNKDIQDYILSAISWQKKTEDLDLSPLTEVIRKYRKPSIVDPVINSLKNSSNTEAEDSLIYVLENYESEWSKTQANAVLHTAGSKKSIVHIKKNIESSSQDLVGSSLLAIIAIGSEEDEPFFRDQLLNGKDHHSAMEGVFRFGGKKSIPAVIERLKKMTSRVRENDCNCLFYPDDNDLTLGLKFLHKNSNNNKEIISFLTFLNENRYSKLFEKEQRVLDDIIKNPAYSK